MKIPHPIFEGATALIERCRERKKVLVTAESCTGGLVMAALTEIAGSSDIVMQGFITYSNEAKMKALGVSEALIAQHGAVSEEVARAMAEGAIHEAASSPVGSAVAVSITGIAGPGGGSESKPVGTVHFAVAEAGRATVHVRRCFDGDRQEIRLAAVAEALRLVKEFIG